MCSASAITELPRIEGGIAARFIAPWHLFLTCTASLISASPSWANNGDQQIAFSARSNAMAGAVIATPQDATTGLTNPAGLSFLHLGEDDLRFDLSLSALNPINTLNGVTSENNLFVLATGAIALKSIFLADNVTVGLGAYALSGGGVDYPAGTFSQYPGTDGPVVAVRQSFRIGPSFAFKINDDLALGITTHVAVGMFGIQAPVFKSPTDFNLGYVWGLGATYNLTPTIRLGATYNAQTRTQEFKFTTSKENIVAGCDPCALTPQQYNLDFEDPASAGIGISYTPTPKLQMEFDLKRIYYRDVRDRLKLIEQSSGDEVVLNLGWDDQDVYALGFNYKFSNRLEFMFGYNYGASPIVEEDLGNNPGLAPIIEHHVTVGAGFRLNKRSELNLSYNRGIRAQMIGVRTGTTEVENATFETNIATLQFSYVY